MKMFKKILIFFLSVILILSFHVAVFADNINAEDITLQVKYLLNSKQDNLSKLKDNSVYTSIQTNDGDVIELRSEKEIKYIYIKFNTPPKSYEIQYNQKKMTCGDNGFIHELITLNETSTSVTLLLNAQKITDILCFTEGELPNYVQQWNEPYDDCDMLLLPTHADDEHLFFGGIMPYYAGEMNKRVQVVYFTNHWGEPYRPHELLDGLWEVGITSYPIISKFNDYYSESLEHAKTLYHTDEMLEYLIENIRRFKPEVIIGHDLNGEYGHGVHMLNAYLLTQAIEKTNDPDIFPQSAQKYGVFDVPKTYLHLYDKSPLVMDVDTPLNAFYGKTAFEKAIDGFAHHKSQQKWFTVKKTGVYDLRKFGLYRSIVGDDSGINDFFENIPKIKEPVLSEITVSETSSVSSKISEITSSQNEKVKTTMSNNHDLFNIAIIITIISVALIIVIIGMIYFKIKR